MTRKMLFCLLVPGAIAVAACQYTPPTTVPNSRLGPLVGGDELLSTGQPWLLDALRTARPTYFRGRGPLTHSEQRMPTMLVVVDGLPVADVELLRSMPVADVVQVRRLSPSETYFRYNRSVSIGALEIVLRR